MLKLGLKIVEVGLKNGVNNPDTIGLKIKYENKIKIIK